MGQPLKHPFQNGLEKCPVENDFIVDFYGDPSETPFVHVVMETTKGVVV